MIKSEPILPIRFYDNFYDQQRFNFHCSDRDQIDLKFPALNLPHFQLRRNKKYNLPDRFFLRSVCTDIDYNYYKVLPEAAANLGNPALTDFIGPFENFSFLISDPIEPGEIILGPLLKIDCDVLTFIPFSPLLVATGSLTITVFASTYLHLKILVDEMTISVGSSFWIKIYAGASLQGVITQPGIYNFNIVMNAATTISVVFDNMMGSDSFKISYLQVTYDPLTIISATDIDLDPSKLKTIPMANGTDIIAYCEELAIYNIPEGEYYYVIGNDFDSYVSEPFKIISLKESEELYKLTWYSTCDINDAILYKSLPCYFRNRLFLDAGLFKPEYDTKEEGEENGKGESAIQFQKWKKNLNLEVGKSPEFLSDALSGIFLHDVVALKKPLNILQESNNGEFSVIKVISDVSQVLEDCFQRVNLKLLLTDIYTDTACCNDAEIFDCTPCKYVTGLCDLGASYGLLMPPSVGVPGLYSCATGNIVTTVREDELICYEGKYVTIKKNVSGNWYISNTYPIIAAVTPSWFFYYVTAYIIPNSFAIIEYDKNGAGWTYLDAVGDDGTGLVVYYLYFSLLIGATSLKLRINNVTLTCDLAYTDEYILI